MQQKKRFRSCDQKRAAIPPVQFPAVALAEGIAFVAVGSPGATVSGAVVATGVDAAVGADVLTGATVGFCVGIDALPRIVQVQPVAKSSSASSGIKKNRFICASPFGSFRIVFPDPAAVIRLRGGENCVILPA